MCFLYSQRIVFMARKLKGSENKVKIPLGKDLQLKYRRKIIKAGTRVPCPGELRTRAKILVLKFAFRSKN